jgi:DNA-directed RNA polymerase II subunit RPB1
MLTDLKALEQNILSGEHALIKGINKVNKAEIRNSKDLPRYNKEIQHFQRQFELYMITDGSNLIDVLSMVNDVDTERTITNDVHEVYKVLGIEAARQALINEMRLCLGEVKLDYRHLSLLVDVMTTKGTLFSIDRHGLNRSDIGPLAKCSFEETSDMLIKAGMFAEYDPINGVSANIMLGQVPPCGTGDSVILIDEGKLLEIDPPDEVKAAETEEDCFAEGLDFSFKLTDNLPANTMHGDVVLNVL